VVLRARGENDTVPAVAAMQQGTVMYLDADLAIEAASVGLAEGLAFADLVVYTLAKNRWLEISPSMSLSTAGTAIARRIGWVFPVMCIQSWQCVAC
jgi:hypothetical protein